jgi:hypothetical protein
VKPTSFALTGLIYEVVKGTVCLLVDKAPPLAFCFSGVGPTSVILPCMERGYIIWVRRLKVTHCIFGSLLLPVHGESQTPKGKKKWIRPNGLLDYLAKI